MTFSRNNPLPHRYRLRGNVDRPKKLYSTGGVRRPDRLPSSLKSNDPRVFLFFEPLSSSSSSSTSSSSRCGRFLGLLSVSSQVCFFLGGALRQATAGFGRPCHGNQTPNDASPTLLHPYPAGHAPVTLLPPPFAIDHVSISEAVRSYDPHDR